MNNSLKIKNYLSRIFQPMINIPKNSNLNKLDINSKSQRLMLELGLIKQATPGCFHLLPLGLRSLEKLINLVDEELYKIDGQKVILPTLVNESLWKKSGRLNDTSSELFKLKDRHSHNYILCPTQEEAVCDLIASAAPMTYKQFPLKLYQITSKFRDEMKPRFGLMRGREFLMKDMYSFDVDTENAKKSYEIVSESYDKIFKRIGLDFVRVLGTQGNIGGSMSHEYHFKADIGEDKVLTCNECSYSANVELCGETRCPKCSSKNISLQSGIEVGHTFLLGDKYSKPLNVTYLASNSKPALLQMGCYGLGLTRILAASIEVLSLEQELRWPDIIAPFNVIIITPKSGSKEESSTKHLGEQLYDNIEMIKNLDGNVLIDDRTSLTIGRRFLEAKRMGYHYVIVVGQKSAESVPLFELNDLKTNKQIFLSENELCNYIKENTSN